MAMSGELMLSRVDDAELVGRIRAGDREAWAEVYRRYGDRLYTLCWSVLRSDEAADATQQAFLVAMQRLDGLRNPAALRPWLFRIGWTEALRRAKARARTVPADVVVAEAVSVEPGPDEAAQQRELQQLVWDAAAGLAAEDRLVLELHVHQGLHGEELAAAIGVSGSYAQKLVARVRARTDRALGALLVATRGRRDCAGLQNVLSGWDGRFTPLVRKRVARHIDGCRLCAQRRSTMASPVTLLGTAPLLAAPAVIGETVRAAVAAAPAPAAAGSTGLQLASLSASRRGLIAAAAATAAAVAGAVLLWPSPPEPAGPSIVGVWRDTWQVERTGDQAYTGIGLTDAIEPDSGCPYRVGETEWQITGVAPHYAGEERWVKGSNGQNCEYAWASATFTLLDDGQTIEVCSTDPFRPGPQLCRRLPRTS